VFACMGGSGLATSTIDHTWDYLNQACRHALRRQRVRTNPVQDALLPEARPPKERKARTVEQARRILFDAIPDDRNPAMWLTGLMCGLRPGELAGCGQGPTFLVRQIDARGARQCRAAQSRRASVANCWERSRVLGAQVMCASYAPSSPGVPGAATTTCNDCYCASF
jgi:hypothetical protein